MKLLKLVVDNLNLYEKESASFDFYATDKVTDIKGVNLITKPIYSQNAIALAGINATGKTSTLKLILGILNVLAGRPISMDLANVISTFRDEDTSFKALIEHNAAIYMLESTIKYNETVSDYDYSAYWVFSEETLWMVPFPKTKKELADLSTVKEHAKIILERSKLDKEAASFLQDDVSIISAYTKKDLQYIPRELMPDSQWLSLSNDVFITTVLQAFDSNIKSCSVDYSSDLSEPEINEPTPLFHLEFKNGRGALAHDPDILSFCLSDGTLKGSNIIIQSIAALKTGGYIVIDEIENHLNKQLVKMILDIFQDQTSNPFGATIIFSTHYPEILDFIKRKDSVYFLSRNDDQQTRVTLYSSKINRIENKKSEVFISNFIGGTAPKYEEIKNLKDYIAKQVSTHA